MTAPAPTEARPRRTQVQRAAETRAKVLDATVASLIEDGYAATTTSAVQQRAEVSRGALMHHFPSKHELLLDAVAHLTAQRGLWLAEQAAALPADVDRQAAGIALLWGAMSGPLFAAATELWIAARTDEDLRRALLESERRLGHAAREFLAEVLGASGPDDPSFRRAFDFVLQVFRGAALTAVLRDDARWERELIATTTELFRQMHDPDPHTSHPHTSHPHTDEETA
ncbi:TetR/AcrR family transcriptional regulator [soil metagenome]